MGIWGKLFKSKREKLLQPADISILRTDIHSHLIPGIDDGADTMEQSIEILKEFERLGYKKVITTPHTMSDYYPNTPEIILSGLEKLREAVEVNHINIVIEAASEYNLDADFENLVEEGELLTFGENYVLFELPFFQEPPMLNDVIWKLQMKNYQPVLAHVERYTFWFDDWQRIEEIKERNVLFQLNINSLTGHYGPEVKKVAERLIDNDMVDFLGSDCHNLNHIKLLGNALQFPYLHKVLKNPRIKNNKL